MLRVSNKHIRGHRRLDQNRQSLQMISTLRAENTALQHAYSVLKGEFNAAQKNIRLLDEELRQCYAHVEESTCPSFPTTIVESVRHLPPNGYL